MKVNTDSSVFKDEFKKTFSNEHPKTATIAEYIFGTAGLIFAIVSVWGYLLVANDIINN